MVSEQSGPAASNVRDLELDLGWLTHALDLRFRSYFADATADAEAPLGEVRELLPPRLGNSPYGAFVREQDLTLAERLALVLALAPDLRPQLLDVFRTRNELSDRHFAQFGGLGRGPEDELRPTGETVAFVLGGDDLEARFAVWDLLSGHSQLAREGVLALETAASSGRARMKTPLRVSDAHLLRFTTGRRAPPPQLGADFPAHRIDTGLGWDDLVLHPRTRLQVAEIELWLEHGHTLMGKWGMGARLRPGHRALFHGPPGTGKTLTASLLGSSTGRPVYRVDLSRMVSKYIGDTEKNLGKVFDCAQQRGWILFFDEAESMFGRRSEQRDSHDRYANQEVAYLLQRIESFDGILILASNMRDNLDQAFTRRFESVIYFPLPQPRERLRLWREGFSDEARLEDVDLRAIARDHELSGGLIMNVIRHVSLRSLHEGSRPIRGAEILQGIRRELAKDGKTG